MREVINTKMISTHLIICNHLMSVVEPLPWLLLWGGGFIKQPTLDAAIPLRHAGVSEQQLPKLVEEHLERNRNVRQRQLRKKQGLPPIRKRRNASELVHITDSRTSKVRAERRQQEQASRVDDGELGPGFAARKPPRYSPPTPPPTPPLGGRPSSF